MLKWHDDDPTNRVQAENCVFPIPSPVRANLRPAATATTAELSADAVTIDVDGHTAAEDAEVAALTRTGSNGLARMSSLNQALSRVASGMATAAHTLAPPVKEEFTCSICYDVVRHNA